MTEVWHMKQDIVIECLDVEVKPHGAVMSVTLMGASLLDLNEIMRLKEVREYVHPDDEIGPGVPE